MKKVNLLIFALAIIISILALSTYLKQAPTPEEPVIEAQPAAPPVPEKQPIVHYPVPVPKEVEQEVAQEQPTAQPIEPEKPALTLPEELPPVEASDQSIDAAIADLDLKSELLALLINENFIQRLVTMIDNLPGKRLPRTHSPVVPPKGRFLVSGTEQAPQTSRRNHARYNDHIALLEAVDPDLALKIYVHFYPLFQKSYLQLGYKNAYFNDRLVYVINHLLETPDPAEPILLAQPGVLYVYQDPLLEQLSAGQKALLRIGPEHRQKVKEMLEIYREKLVNLKP